MDKTDYQILEVLIENSKASTREISGKTGIQQMTVLRRIKKLEEDNIIRHYTVKINHEKLGFSVVAYVFIKTDYSQCDPSATLRSDVMTNLSKYPFISCIGSVTGRKDILVRVRARNIKELEKFIAAISMMKEISDTETMVVLNDVVRSPNGHRKLITFLRDKEYAESFFVDNDGKPLRRGKLEVK